MGVDFQPGEEEGERGSGVQETPWENSRSRENHEMQYKYRRDTGWEAAVLVYATKKIKTVWWCLKVLNK